MVKVPRVEKCCCWFSLNVGVKIIGFFETIIGTLGLIFLISEGLNGHEGSIDQGQDPKEDARIKISQYIGSIFYAIFGTVLLLAVFKKDQGLLKLWLIINGFIVALSFLMIIGYLILGIHWLDILQFALSEVFQTYVFLVVYSYYTEGS